MRFVGIDPSTKTGFVALSPNGQILKQKQLSGLGDLDPKRMVTLLQEIVAHLQAEDFVCIEGFPYDTQRAMFAGGLHHGIRNELYKRKLTYFEPAPNAVKKWVGVTGFVGVPGDKRRLKGDETKQAVIEAIFNIYKIRFTNDNIADAFVLSKIARAIKAKQRDPNLVLPKHQEEVIKQILNPDPKPKKKRTKKKATA